ncbi:MAG: hypothetical protein EOM10_09125 [Opitutae bacterium]|nr:hypothetical protein [Opitutae bacterium]
MRERGIPITFGSETRDPARIERRFETAIALARPAGLVSGSGSSCPSFVSGFLQTLPRGNALAFDCPIPLHLGPLGTVIPATCPV